MSLRKGISRIPCPRCGLEVGGYSSGRTTGHHCPHKVACKWLEQYDDGSMHEIGSCARCAVGTRPVRQDLPDLHAGQSATWLRSHGATRGASVPCTVVRVGNGAIQIRHVGGKTWVSSNNVFPAKVTP